MTYEDSMIEIDFKFSHGQNLTLHFTKNCYNIEPKAREVIKIENKKLLI